MSDQATIDSAPRADAFGEGMPLLELRSVEVAYGDSRIGSKYRGQRDPTASLYHRDFDRGRLLPGERSRNRG